MNFGADVKGEARYVGCTMQRLANRKNNMFPQASGRKPLQLENSHLVCVKTLILK